MSFVLSVAVIVALALIVLKFTPDKASFLLMEDVFAKRMNNGQISFEAKRLPPKFLASSDHGPDFVEGRNTSLVNLRLSDLAQVKPENSKPADTRNFEELASRLLVDCVSVDARGGIVAAPVSKAERAPFILSVLHSANINAMHDQAKFDAQCDSHRGRQKRK